MTFHIQKHEDERIIVANYTADYRPAQHMPLSNEAMQQALDTSDRPHTVIRVFNFAFSSLDEMIHGANDVSRGANALWHHPNIKQNVIVSADDLVHMAAQGLNTEAFGYLNIPVFSTLDEALAHARTQA